jgi:hypothetical protein
MSSNLLPTTEPRGNIYSLVVGVDAVKSFMLKLPGVPCFIVTLDNPDTMPAMIVSCILGESLSSTEMVTSCPSAFVLSWFSLKWRSDVLR